MPAQRRSFAQTRWESTLSVPVRTLDELIARYGEPRFCKVDVEGFEPDVLRGLSRPLQALSFEYVAPNYARAAACVERLDALGAYVYAWSSGESMRLHPCGWLEARELLELLRTFTADEQPGDVYARRR